MSLFWVVLSVLVIVAAVLIRLRIHEPPGGRGSALDDDAIRRIEETGRLRTGEAEPLDQEAIDEAERRFWEEEWDEPEEF